MGPEVVPITYRSGVATVIAAMLGMISSLAGTIALRVSLATV
jgi:hypothetical protein